MKIWNVRKVRSGFHVIETNRHSQSATMILSRGESSSDRLNRHPRSDQTLHLLSGRLTGEIGKRKVQLKKGDVLTIPAATPHRFSNPGRTPAVTLNVYSPPAY